ncbi:MAG: tetratricopeptide repeat protein [Treponema sp.]|nr:tetratricopeptide repeat protein [Treponema sp.]
MRKSILISCLFFAAFTLCAGSDAPNEEAIGHYNKGMEFYHNNDFLSAIKEFSQAIELFPEYTDAYIGRGNSYDNINDAQKALQDYIAASRLDEKFIYFAYGYECIVILENYDEGIASLIESVEQGINTVLAHSIIGNGYLGKEDFKKAVEIYSEVIKLSPNFSQAYFNRGSAYFLLNNIDAAIKDYEKASDLYPDFIMAYYALGTLYTIKGDTKKAEEMFTIFKSLNPNNNI